MAMFDDEAPDRVVVAVPGLAVDLPKPTGECLKAYPPICAHSFSFVALAGYPRAQPAACAIYELARYPRVSFAFSERL